MIKRQKLFMQIPEVSSKKEAMPLSDLSFFFFFSVM
jgi:hypothetical protein